MTEYAGTRRTYSLPRLASVAEGAGRRLRLHRVLLVIAAVGVAALAGWALSGSTRSVRPASDHGAYLARSSRTGVVLLRNPVQGLVASVGGGRLSVSGARGLRFGLGTPTIGRRGASTVAMGLGTAAVDRNRIVLSARDSSEWFANGPLGVEQGFFLAERPSGTGPLVISQPLAGDLATHIDGETLTFSSRAGSLSYGALIVTDARGQRVPARLGVSAHRLTITIDDTHAVYPLRVDPTIVRSGGRLMPQDDPVAPTITSGSSTTFQVGSSGSFTVTTTGDPTPTFSDGGATLPSGVTFVDNGDGTATLSGTPAAGSGGSYPFTITATNGNAPDATQSFTLTVEDVPEITSASAATFTAGSAGTFTVTTSGYPAPSLSDGGGPLPSGVQFVDNGDGTATLSGTPAAGSGGEYPITITASNGVSPDASQSFTLTVDEAPGITSGSSASFAVGSAGSFTVTTSGYPAPALSDGGATLPSGVQFVDNGNGTATLAGMPAAGQGGSYPFTITASNGTAPAATQSFTLTVDQAPGITSGSTTSFTVGSAGSFTVTSTGYPAPALSESGALPANVGFVDNGNGTATLSGTPAAGTAGSYPFTITASNGVGTNATQSFTLTVANAPVAPVITSASSTTFTIGSAGSFTVRSTGNPTAALSHSGSLPNGVGFVDNGDGTATLSGTPGAGTAGTYPFTITASNGVGTNATQSFTLRVDQAPAITSASSTSFSVGSAGSFTVRSTGNPTAALSYSGSLPNGVGFVDNGDGTARLSGTPAAGSGGSYPLTITAANGAAVNATQSFTLTVDEEPGITSASSASFTVGSAGSFTVTSSGYPAAAWSSSGSLPSGVQFVDNGNGTATLSGTPAAGSGGSYPFTITASNGVGSSATQSFTLTVITPPPAATIGTGTASAVTATSATLSWTVEPDGDNLSSYSVSCGPVNGALPVVRAAASTPTGAIPADQGSHALTTPISGLLPGTAYKCTLSMADAEGRSYASSPAVESLTTLTPTFLAFSGAAEAAGQLSWKVNPEGDAFSAYAVVCRSSAGNAKATGTIAAATLPSDELSHTLTLSVKGVAQGASNSCVLSLTDASGLTFSDAPQTLLTSSVNVPTSVTSNGLFAAIGGSCGGAKGTTCSGSGDDVAGAVVLGRFQFQIRARHRGTILFRLTAAGHRLVAHNHRLATTLVITVKIHGRKVTSRTPLTIAYKA